MLLLLAAPVQGQSLKTVTRVSAGVGVGLCGADLALTQNLLGRAQEAQANGRPVRIKEGNPVLAWAAEKPVAMAAIKMGGCAAVTTLVLKTQAKRPKTALATSIAFNALQALIVWHNQKQFDKIAGRGPKTPRPLVTVKLEM